MAKDLSASAGKQLQCLVVTPETTVLDEAAEFVALPLFDGEKGIAPLHAPLIGRLGFGELRIVNAGRTQRYYVDGGFVQVLDNVVSVLTNRAVLAGQIKAETAEQLLTTARAQRAPSDEAQAIRDRAQLQARAQLRISRRGGSGRSETSSH